MSNIGNQLNELFSTFTEQLLEEVKAAKEANIPIAAADKAAIIRFLQINNITYAPHDDDTLAALREQLLNRSTNKKTSALEALRSADKDLESLYGDRLQ